MWLFGVSISIVGRLFYVPYVDVCYGRVISRQSSTVDVRYVLGTVLAQC